MKISKKNLMSFARNHLDMIDFFENDIIVDQIVINPSDCKTLVTMKYGIITEDFILYK